MKKYIYVFFLFFPILAASPEIIAQGYVISILGVSSGSAAPMCRFKDKDSESRFLFPFEIAVSPLYNDRFSLSANTVISVYNEDDKFSSLNISVGTSAFLHTRRNQLPMTGRFISLYPMYELPIVADGKTPYYDWRAALDYGRSFLFAELFQMTLYMRNIFAWENGNFAYFMDVGIAFGMRSGMRANDVIKYWSK